MEPDEYQTMFEVEGEHWWYAGLRELLASFLEKNTGPILDAGCGTGATLSMLTSYGVPFGADSSRIAIEFCKKRNLTRLTRASIAKLPFVDEKFDVVVSLDVLYHQGVSDEMQALSEFLRVLKRGGKLFLNLPAFESLRSDHDRVIHTARRYRRGEIEQKLRKTGLQIKKITYRNSLLFPFVLGKRWLQKLSASRQPRSDLKKLPAGLNSILYGALKLENQIIRRINLPIGSSVFCVAIKP